MECDTVDTTLVARTFHPDSTYCDNWGYRVRSDHGAGCFSLAGHVTVLNPVTLLLTPAAIALHHGNDIYEIHGQQLESQRLSICFLDEQLFVEGTTSDAAHRLRAWGREEIDTP